MVGMGVFPWGAVDLAAAAVVLCATLGVGTVAHELSHVFVLRWLGVPCEVRWLSGQGTPSSLGAGVTQAWATVTPTAVPNDVSSRGLRVAAIAPLALATPFVLVLFGVLPDPLASGDLLVAAATAGWFGCALPSPQDFSLFWHPSRALDESVGATGADRPPSGEQA